MITTDSKLKSIVEPTLDERLTNARSWAYSMKHYLREALNEVTTTRMADENHQRDKLTQTIEDFARATARVAMLEMLSTEDFFLAVSHSASKMGEKLP